MSDIGLSKISEFQDIIGRLDRKANFLLAAVALVVGLMSDGAGALHVIAVALALGALVASIAAIWPRTPLRGNDLSWVIMADLDETQIVRHLESTDRDAGVQLVATHLKTLAQICRFKVRAIRLCGVLLAVSVAVNFLDGLT